MATPNKDPNINLSNDLTSIKNFPPYFFNTSTNSLLLIAYVPNLATTTDAAKLAKYGEGIEAGRKAIKAANITIKNIDQYMIPAFNTIAEAGAESKGAWDAMESRKDDAHEEYMSKLNPNNSRFQTAIFLKNRT